MKSGMMLQTNALTVAMGEIESGCTNCGGCAVRCSFLKEYGTPAEIVTKIRELPPEAWPDPFHCSLCGLCNVACPVNLEPEKLFLAMRRARVLKEGVDFKPYKPILAYEKIGDSSLFSYLGLPPGCDTVLFPGCALPATRPTTVKRLFRALQKVDSKIGIALGCCIKPSHDLGREAHFEERFGVLHEKLVAAGVKRVITACPNCQKIFQTQGAPLEAVPAVRILADTGYAPTPLDGPPTVVHDPCPQRHDRQTQQAVRAMAERCGMDLEKMPAQGAATRCCGEGGMVGFVRPDFAKAWTAQRVKAAKGRRVVTSCAGCAGFLGREMETVHILDEVFRSKPSLPIKPPFTYAVRLWLKAWFKRVV